MFKMQFKTGNSSFGDYPELEISKTLRAIATKISMGAFEGKIKDENGNTIGEYLYKRDE